jgi:ppGpp synthetase/RelA/SpoT-type nucleotidyltranferase
VKFPAEVVSKDIQDEIIKSLDQMGIMYRIFGRVKNMKSLLRKLESDILYGDTKMLQDFIGIRVVLYFADDVALVHKAISRVFSEREKDQSIDDMNDSTFMPVRYNLVYDVLESMSYELSDDISSKVDRTFELQIRTMLSEGWHEVEHDLRYKCSGDWDDFPTESRKLNGVYASLETNEWTMIKIFEEIAYGHYQNSNWESMLRQKFRLRLASSKLDDRITLVFSGGKEIAKKFYRVDRNEVVSLMNEKEFGYPITISNIIYFSNIFIVKDEEISKITPNILKDEYSEESMA